MSIIKHVTLQKIVAHDFRYDLRIIILYYLPLVHYRFFLYSDLFLPAHVRCRGLLLDLITLDDTRMHAHTHTSVRLLWTNDRPVADLSLTAHNNHKRHIHAPGGIRIHDSRKSTAADPRLRPRGYQDRLYQFH